jgi:hypothetical protein
MSPTAAKSYTSDTKPLASSLSIAGYILPLSSFENSGKIRVYFVLSGPLQTYLVDSETHVNTKAHHQYNVKSLRCIVLHHATPQRILQYSMLLHRRKRRLQNLGAQHGNLNPDLHSSPIAMRLQPIYAQTSYHHHQEVTICNIRRLIPRRITRTSYNGTVLLCILRIECSLCLFGGCW